MPLYEPLCVHLQSTRIVISQASTHYTYDVLQLLNQCSGPLNSMIQDTIPFGKQKPSEEGSFAAGCQSRDLCFSDNRSYFVQVKRIIRIDDLPSDIPPPPWCPYCYALRVIVTAPFILPSFVVGKIEIDWLISHTESVSLPGFLGTSQNGVQSYSDLIGFFACQILQCLVLEKVLNGRFEPCSHCILPCKSQGSGRGKIQVSQCLDCIISSPRHIKQATCCKQHSVLLLTMLDQISAWTYPTNCVKRSNQAFVSNVIQKGTY